MSSETPQKFTVLLKHTREGTYTVHCIEVPISCQGKTKEEALKHMQISIESTGWKLKKTKQKDKNAKTEKTSRQK